MGAAKDRRVAMAFGQPDKRDMNRCPVCRSWRTVIAPAPAMAMSHIGTPHGVCADCKTVWEAYPADWSHDAVEAPPCDNCAFAKGSPESADKNGWRELLAGLKSGREFKCHKGAPILINEATSEIGFDEGWVQRKGRTCAGFVRAMQRWPDWFEKRYPGLRVAVEETGL